MDLHAYLIFAMTSAVVVLSPGATAVLIASQGARNGWRATMVGICGVILATAIYFVLSASGLATLMAASNILFQLVKWIGVVFLIYLGCTAIFSKAGRISIRAGTRSHSYSKLFSQGFIVEFANPKALLYFSAILPQFLDVTNPIAPQMIIMGVTGTAMQLVIYSIYAKMGDRLANGGIRKGLVSLINKAAGAALIFTGIKMASVTANR